MEALSQLSKWIPELLGTHSCVTIPGLGSFIYRETPASGNSFTHEIKPSGRTVFFNNAIVSDDGILVSCIREKTGNSYNEALNLANKAASEIRLQLDSKRSVPFGNLGNFFLNNERQVFFLPAPSLNLSHDTFGLPVIKLSELETRSTAVKNISESESNGISSAKASQAESIEIEEAHVVDIDETDNSKNRRLGYLWKAAAVLAIVALTSAGIYYISVSSFLNQKNNGTTAAVIPVPENSDASAVIDNEGPAQEMLTNETVAATVEPENINSEITETTAPTIDQDAFLKQLSKSPGEFYVLGGMYMTLELAQIEVSQWNELGVNAAAYKPAKSSLVKVILGRFDSEKAASDYTQKIPNFSGAHLSVRNTPLLNKRQ